MTSIIASLGTTLLFPLLLLSLLLLILKHFKPSSLSNKVPPLPPGPKPWPILGNIFHMGKKPHIAFTRFAEMYGPLISLRLGTQIMVVGSSPEIAIEILRTNDRIFSSRHVPQSFPVKNPELNINSLAWAVDCGDRWKYLRTICRTEIFSVKAIESQAGTTEEKVREMLVYLRKMEGKVIKLGEIVYVTVYNTLSNILLSRDLMSLEDDKGDGGMSEIIRAVVELAVIPNLAEFYPVLGVFDIQGLKKKLEELTIRMYSMWEDIIIEKRLRKQDALKGGDFLDALIQNDFTDGQINELFKELFSAGTDTSSSTIEWAMAELIKNPKSMRKLQEELVEKTLHADPNVIIRESNLPNLPYLQACIKETLRLHPPAPFLLPRRALEKCQVMNYTIPTNSQVLINVWAIGRDPKHWEDPLMFRPERFLVNSTIEFKGTDFELIPFGAGRRICPGIAMATKQVSLIIANLIHSFDWSLPDMNDPAKLDMSEKFGITLQKEHPLLLIAKTRK